MARRPKDENGGKIKPLPAFSESLEALSEASQPSLNTLDKDAAYAEVLQKLDEAQPWLSTPFLYCEAEG